jgi:hypothetical protein
MHRRATSQEAGSIAIRLSHFLSAALRPYDTAVSHNAVSELLAKILKEESGKGLVT